MQRLSFHQQLFLITYGIFFSCLGLFGLLTYYSIKDGNQQNMDLYIDTLAKGTAIYARDILLANDTLGLHILLNELVSSPAINEAKIRDREQKVLATAGVKGAISNTSNQPSYKSPITREKEIIGYLEIKINHDLNDEIIFKLLSNALIYSIPLLVLAYILLLRYNQIQCRLLLGASQKLAHLCRTNNIPLKPIRDELLYLDTHLLALKSNKKNAKQKSPLHAASSALLVIRVNNLHPLKRQMNYNVLQNQLDLLLSRVEKAAALYGGTLHYASEGSGFIEFRDKSEQENVLNSACCARLISQLLAYQEFSPPFDLRMGLSLNSPSLTEESSSILPDSNASKALINAFTQQQGIVADLKINDILKGDVVNLRIDHSGNCILTHLSNRYEALIYRECQQIMHSEQKTQREPIQSAT